MGGHESKLIPHDVAARRFSQEELHHLRASFHKLSKPGELLDRQGVLTYVLDLPLPQPLIQQLYYALDGLEKGISFQTLVSGLAVFLRGTVAERTRFVFHVYDVEHTGLLTSSMTQLLLVNESIAPFDQFFKRQPTMTPEQFVHFVEQNPTATGLIEWIRLPPAPSLANLRIPTFFQTMASVTKFTEAEIAGLQRRFWHIKARGPVHHVAFDAALLIPMASPPLTQELLSRVMYLWDTNHDGTVEFRELLSGLSDACRGTIEERYKFCFRVFDVAGTGVLGPRDVLGMAGALRDLHAIRTRPPTREVSRLRSMSEASRTSADEFAGEDPDEPPAPVEEVQAPPGDQPFVALDTAEGTKMCDDVMAHRTAGDQPGIAVDDFVAWARTSGALNQFLDSLNLVATVLFGLRPSVPAHEGAALRAWLECVPDTPPERGQRVMRYLVSRQWWDAWHLFVGQPLLPHLPASPAYVPASPGTHAASTTPPNPGAISNGVLVRPPPLFTLHRQTYSQWGARLKQNLIRNTDYVVLSEAVWSLLYHWYDGGPVMARPLIATGSGEELELYPFTVKILRHAPASAAGATLPSRSHSETSDTPAAAPSVSFAFMLDCSRAWSLKDLVRNVVAQHRTLSKGKGGAPLRENSVRLWKYTKPEAPVLLDGSLCTLQELGLEDNTPILLEVRNADLSWPSELYLVATARKAATVETALTPAPAAARVPGTCGLSNLGNTCFMNSALQCLSNTDALTQYFNRGLHLAELNRTNPLGAKGIMALRYAELLTQLWSGRGSVAPVQLRRTVARIAPQFAGHQQHDSQELLALLLDNLHEDLNRVKTKPYVERKDSNGRPDAIVAKESWDGHIARNQSVVVDLFHGLLRSQVRCKTCNFASVSFDPFTFLTLPLPTESVSLIDVCVHRLDGSVPVHYCIESEGDAVCVQVKTTLGNICGLHPDQLVFVECMGGAIQRVFPSNTKLRALSGGMLLAYEVVPDGPLDILPQAAKAEAPTATPTPTPFPDPASIPLPLPPTDVADSAIAGPAAATDDASAAAPAGAGEDVVVVSTVDAGQRVTQFPATVGAASAAIGPSLPYPTPSVMAPARGRAGMLTHVRNHIMAVHRRVELQALHLLVSPLAVTVFGSPILFPLPAQGARNIDLYQAIWVQVRRFIVANERARIEAAIAAMSSSSSSSSSSSTDGSAYPFQLKYVSLSGRVCGRCPWNRFCFGCAVPPTEDTFTGDATVTTLGIDWDLPTLHRHYEASEERKIDTHESVAAAHKKSEEAINLDDCMRAFTREEDMGAEDLWYCSRCKEHRQARKKLDIWTVPPVLIIHLKRFQLVNGRWSKSQRQVHFPLRDLNPYRPAAPAAEVAAAAAAAASDGTAAASDASAAATGDGPAAAADASPAAPSDAPAAASDAPAAAEPASLPRGADLHPRFFEAPALERVYDLHAMSIHLGIMGGGHYVAYARNPVANQWYFFNDSACKPVTEERVLRENAYILFYTARGLQPQSVLPAVAKVPVVRADDEEEFEDEPDANVSRFANCVIS